MDFSSLLDTSHGLSNFILSICALIFLQLLYKIADFLIKQFLRRQEKRLLDIRRAFHAIKMIAGEDWPKIREEIMKDEKFD